MHLQALAEFRVIDLGHVAVGQHVGVIGGFEQCIDRCSNDVGGAQPGHPIIARAGREQLVEHAQQPGALCVGADDHAEIAKSGVFESLVKAECGHRVAPFARTVELEYQRLAVAVVEAGAEAGARGGAGDAGLPGHRVAVAPHRRRQGPAH